MMMQKTAEMMFSIPLAKRQIADLENAIEQGAKAQRFVSVFDSRACWKLTIKQQIVHFLGCRRVSFSSIRQEYRRSEAEVWR